jgi:hypothetical protein
VTVLAGGIAMVIVTFAADIVELVFQPAYLAAMVVTQALAVRAVLAVGPFLLEPVAAGLGRTGMVMRYNMFGAAVSLAAVFAAAPFGLAVLAWSQAVTGGLLTLGAIAVIGRSGGLRTGPALQRFGLALLLTLGYGAVLHLIRRATVEVIADPVTALLAGLALGVLAGFAAIAVAARLRVFQLAAFSG